MIISDLNYIETLEGNTIVGGSWWGKRYDVNFDKKINIDVDFDQDFNTDINFDKDVDIDVDVDQDVDVDGNFANLTFDVQAIGTDTFSQGDVVVLAVENEFSGVSGALTAGVR